MTGPEHYQMAERALRDLGTELYADGRGRENRGLDTDSLLAKAQVHATLALAAGTAMSGDMHSPDWHDWHDVASTTGRQS